MAAPTKFRSHWCARIRDPTVKHYWLPTPPPPTAQEAIPEYEPEAKEVMEEAPRGADVKFNVLDRMRNFRAFISSDGTCTNNAGDITGYINLDSHEVGTVDMAFLGFCKEGLDNQVEVMDATDELVGIIDLGLGTLKTPQGTTVVEIHNSGEVFGHGSSFLGQFEGFTFKDMRTIALYMMLVDSGMVNEIEG